MPTSLKQDLLQMRKAKLAAEELGRRKKEADATFKQRQYHVLQRMEAEDIESMKTGGTLFSVVEKIKGQVDDRARYVRWALENDEGLQAFLHDLRNAVDLWDDLIEDFYEAITGTELIEYKEKGDQLNQLVRRHIDDGEILPPGVTFRPDNYVSQRAA